MRIILFSLFLSFAVAKKLPDIHWSSKNPLIERYAAIGDTLDIVCPSFGQNVHPSETEQTLIYRVTEDDYENCRLSSSAQLFTRCANPYKSQKWTASFRTSSAIPSALIYKPGQIYYFISTSTGEHRGLNNDIGGLCASHNLKMILHIVSKDGDISGRAPIHQHRHHHKHSTTVKTTTTEVATEPTPVSGELTSYWNDFIEKLSHDQTWAHPKAGAAERVFLERGDKKDEYIPVISENDGWDFQIHEIGEVDHLYSTSTHSFSCFPSIFLVVLAGFFIL